MRKGNDPMSLKSAASIFALAIAATGCSPSREPVPFTPSAESGGAAVVRRAIPESPPPGQVASPAPGARAPAPPVVVPPDAIYVCVSESGGVRQQTAIEFSPKVGAMCAKHPEMGPCQYERNACRGNGGRVYAAGGVEITGETEAEYDRKVTRVRFRAN
jgi:hypothetical protein